MIGLVQQSELYRTKEMKLLKNWRILTEKLGYEN